MTISALMKMKLQKRCRLEGLRMETIVKSISLQL